MGDTTDTDSQDSKNKTLSQSSVRSLIFRKGTEAFVNDPEFCTTCGAILSLSRNKTANICSVCHNTVLRKTLAPLKYTIHFNNPDVYSSEDKLSDQKLDGRKKKNVKSKGPVVTRECKECGYNQMSYATLQLRSADEGQTVFFTCTRCNFKESENS